MQLLKLMLMKRIFYTFLLVLLSYLSFGQVDLLNGLVAYYPFSGNANDASGNGNNASFNNATLTTDFGGNANSAYLFNGTTNYIQIPNSSTLNISTNKISMCVLVKPMGFYSGLCDGNILVAKQFVDYINGNYSMRFQDVATGCSAPDHSIEVFTGSVGTASGTGVATAPAPYVQLNQWYCVIYTNDGVTGKLYIDATLVNSSPVTSGFTLTNAQDLFIGKMNNVTYPYWFNGVMDEVRIYNRALNSDEVLALCPAAIPITLTAFTGAYNSANNSTLLKWTTVNEINSKAFIVERSTDNGATFIPQGSVNAHGYSNSPLQYIYTDHAPTRETNLYRLKEIDADNKYRYSKIVSVVSNSATVNNFYLSPNPATGYTLINSASAKEQLLNVRLLDASGRVLLQKAIRIDNSHPYKLNINPAKGVYFINLQHDGVIETKKLVVE
jgi:hypothetical protein